MSDKINVILVWTNLSEDVILFECEVSKKNLSVSQKGILKKEI